MKKLIKPKLISLAKKMISAAKKSGAHVLEVDSIEDVNIDNVYNFIQQVSNT